MSSEADTRAREPASGAVVSQPLPIRARSGTGPIISTLEDWQRLASTRGKWEDGFSAKELARLWLAGDGAEAARCALRPVLPGLRFENAVAEAMVSFDSYAGGVRNHDVLAKGRTAGGQVLVGVEGKVNEPLGARIKGQYHTADKTKAEGKNTNLEKRINHLLAAILGATAAHDLRVGDLRYQLFTAIAGTVAAATANTFAVAVVIHLIRTPFAQPKKFEQTRVAVADFASAAGADRNGDVVGPITLNSPIASAPLGIPIWLTVVETPSAEGSPETV